MTCGSCYMFSESQSIFEHGVVLIFDFAMMHFVDAMYIVCDMMQGVQI